MEILKQEPILLQLVGSHKKLGYGNDKDYRGFFLNGPRFERHMKIDGIDYDLWNATYAEKQISRGLNSCPVLYSCLFGDNYEVLTEQGQDLIDRRDQFRSNRLITGCLRFTDRKIKTSQRPRAKHNREKYVYYACSDIWEQIEILNTGDCVYPLRFDDEELQLILDLKSGKRYDEGVEWYNFLKNNLQKIRI